MKKKKKNPIFTFKGIDLNRKRNVNGTIEGVNKKHAIIKLNKMRIKEKKISVEPMITNFSKRKLSKKEFLKFISYYKMNLQNEQNTIDILNKYAKSNPNTAYLFYEAKDIYTKTTKIETVLNHIYDDPTIIKILGVAENSGSLQETVIMLEELLTEEIETQKELNSKLKMPKITLFFGIMAFINASYWLIPNFAKVMKDLKYKPTGAIKAYYGFFNEFLHDPIYEDKVIIALDVFVVIFYWFFPKTKLFKQLVYTFLPIFKTRDREVNNILNYKLLETMLTSGIRIDYAFSYIGSSNDRRALFLSKQLEQGLDLSESMDLFNRAIEKKPKKALLKKKYQIENFFEYSQEEINYIEEGEQTADIGKAFEKIIRDKKDVVKNINEAINATIPILFTFLTATLIGAIFLLLIFPVTQAVMSKM